MRPWATREMPLAARPPCSLSKYFVFVAVIALSLGTHPTPVGADPVLISSCGPITAPGSYLVTQNLTAGAPSGVCIEVQANHVTIDLGGWTIEGIVKLVKTNPPRGVPFTGVGYTVRNGIFGPPPGLPPSSCGVVAEFTGRAHSSEIVIEQIIFDQCRLLGGASLTVRNSILSIQDVAGEAVITANLINGVEVHRKATIIGNVFTAGGTVGAESILKYNMILGDVAIGQVHTVSNNAIRGALRVSCPGLELGNAVTGGVVPGCTAVGNSQ